MAKLSTEEFKQKIEKILSELLTKNNLEVFGNLKVEVANMDAPALIKRGKIYINIKLASFPEHALKYVIAHELAHLIVKRHTRKFWETVKRIYPQYEKSKEYIIKKLVT